ncbi:MAG: hypothetical protein HQK73_07055 [Desulfamplus sp.]|nr:hypothetical protein [Desulfamplus sp.]
MTHSVSEINELQTEVVENDKSLDNRADEFLQDDLDQLTNYIKEQNASARERAINESIDEILLPELQGLEILKEGAYVLDPEKTISNMVSVVKKMEAQLESALMLNSHLEKDLNDSKEMIIDLRAEKIELENTIKRMEEEIPSKREFQIEIEYLIDERNATQRKIKDLKELISKKDKQIDHYKEKVSNLEEDKKDYSVEMDYLVRKLDAMLENNRDNIAKIKQLEQEKRTAIEKISTLEDELRKADEKRYNLYKEMAR